MRIIKVIKDSIAKVALGDSAIPRGLFELSEYFRHNGAIKFNFHKEDGLIVAVSENFGHGSIVTHGKDLQELDRNIKDAILTAFEVPSVYAPEANIRNIEEREYALA